MINPLKRKNEIWYEINLFEKDIAETFQQIIPDSNKNKKILNYPVDKSLKQPFALYLTASIFTKTKEELEDVLSSDYLKNYPQLLSPIVLIHNQEEIEDIIKLLEDNKRQDLISPTVVTKEFEKVEKMIGLPFLLYIVVAIRASL